MSSWRSGKRKRLPSSTADTTNVGKGVERKQAALFSMDDLSEKFSSPTASQDDNYLEVDWDGRPELERLSQAPGAVADIMAKCSSTGCQPSSVLEITDGGVGGKGKGSGSSPVIQFLYSSPNQHSLLTTTPTRSPVFMSKRRSRLAIDDHKSLGSGSSRGKSSTDMLQRVMSMFDSMSQQQQQKEAKADSDEAVKNSSSAVTTTMAAESNPTLERKVFSDDVSSTMATAQLICDSDLMKCCDEQVSCLDDSWRQRDEDVWTDDDVFANESFIRATQCVVESEVCLQEPDDDKPVQPQASSTPASRNKAVSKLSGFGSTVRQTIPVHTLGNINTRNSTVSGNLATSSANKSSTSSVNRIVSPALITTSNCVAVCGTTNVSSYKSAGHPNAFNASLRHGSSDTCYTKPLNQPIPFKSKSHTDFNNSPVGTGHQGNSFRSRYKANNGSKSISTFANNPSFSTKSVHTARTGTSESTRLVADVDNHRQNIENVGSKEIFKANVRRLSASFQNVEVSGIGDVPERAWSDKQQTESLECRSEIDISFSDKLFETFAEPDDVLDSQLCDVGSVAEPVTEETTASKDDTGAEVQAHASFTDDDLMTEPEVLAYLDCIEFSATQATNGNCVPDSNLPQLPQSVLPQNIQSDKQQNINTSGGSNAKCKPAAAVGVSSALLSSVSTFKGMQSIHNPLISSAATVSSTSVTTSVRFTAVSKGFVFNGSALSRNPPTDKCRMSNAGTRPTINNNCSSAGLNCNTENVDKKVVTNVGNKSGGFTDYNSSSKFSSSSRSNATTTSSTNRSNATTTSSSSRINATTTSSTSRSNATTTKYTSVMCSQSVPILKYATTTSVSVNNKITRSDLNCNSINKETSKLSNVYNAAVVGNPVPCSVANVGLQTNVSLRPVFVKSCVTTSYTTGLQSHMSKSIARDDAIKSTTMDLSSVSSTIAHPSISYTNISANYRGKVGSDGARRFTGRPATTGSIQNSCSVVTPLPGSQPIDRERENRIHQPTAGRKYTREEIEQKRQEALRKRQLSLIKS